MKYLGIFVFLTLLLSCNNDRRNSSFNAEDKLYLRIVFEDFFQNDLLDLWINDKKILEKDSLNSSFSDGVTNTAIYIYNREGKYIVKVQDNTISIPIKDSLVHISILLNNENIKFDINPRRGIYVGLNKKTDGTLRIAQNESQPMYD
ncbi:MAG: hypothetical protein LBJ04_04850 [Sphingobacterium sp.]|jgi:hypothetical protein|nr:hypothetical protein [Sphingobacterium sp.]